MAENTYQSYLMRKKDTAYEKLIDIKDYPDLGGSPEMLETTTLSDPMQTYIPGIQSSDAMEFNTNYTKDGYSAIKELENQELDLAVWFGGSESNGIVTPDGHDGKFEFKGKVSARVTGGGVNEVRGMAVTIAPSTPIKLAAS